MDPNATVQELYRSLTELALDAQERREASCELAHYLCQWIEKGGFLPEDTPAWRYVICEALRALNEQLQEDDQ